MLIIEDATKTFGSNTVVDRVSLEIRPGEIHALLGANGAGKSTLINILGGRFPDAPGSFTLNGRAIRLASPVQAIRDGISIVHQETDLVPDLTAAENIFIGQELADAGGVMRLLRPISRSALTDKARRLLQDFRLDIPADVPVRRLAVAEQQLVQIARTLSRRSDVVIFDEPTARLGPNERNTLFAIFDRLRADGRMLIFVTHYLDEVIQVADRATVMRDGRRVDTVAIADTDVQGISRMMVGDDVVAQKRLRKFVAPVAAIEVIQGQLPGLEALSLRVEKGEIVGLLGHPGSGRHELTRAVLGHLRKDRGKARVGFLPEDRRAEAIFPMLSVGNNITLGALSDRRILSPRNRSAEGATAQGVIQRFALRCRDADQPIGELSGGNQQKAVFGRATILRPEAYVIECPTVGVDVKAASELHRLIFELADGGAGILLATDDLDEALGLCDRLVVMFRNRIVAEFGSGEATRQSLIAAMGAAKEKDHV